MPESIQDHICDETLFASFFKKQAKDLHDFLFYKFGSGFNPKDIVQDAFVKVWQNCGKIPPNKAKSFLFTTANNLMLNEVAHKKVVQKHEQIKPKSISYESPEFVLEEQEYALKLENALSNLTEAQRTAFLLNRVEGKRFKEIAELLGISTKAVEKRIYGALKKIRKEIEGI